MADKQARETAVANKQAPAGAVPPISRSRLVELLNEDQLVLRAAHKAEAEEKERGYREWRRQEFYRSVPLPGGIDADKVEATYRNGILSVTLPKTEQGKGRRLQVKD